MTQALNQPLPALSLAVVGVHHPNKDKSHRRFEIELCAPGEPVQLLPEPKNRHDERAVAVFSSRDVQLGYLTAERCGRIGALIREGREVRAAFQASAKFGAWIRVAFDGDEPRIPAAEKIGSEADDGFYPDESWPEN